MIMSSLHTSQSTAVHFGSSRQPFEYVRPKAVLLDPTGTTLQLERIKWMHTTAYLTVGYYYHIDVT